MISIYTCINNLKAIRKRKQKYLNKLKKTEKLIQWKRILYVFILIVIGKNLCLKKYYL